MPDLDLLQVFAYCLPIAVFMTVTGRDYAKQRREKKQKQIQLAAPYFFNDYIKFVEEEERERSFVNGFWEE